MNVPSGYSALDLVGFTDKGDYSASTNYVKNDLVHYNDKIWKCLIDDTTAIEPTEGVNWTLWIQQSNSLDGLADVEITNAQDGQEITYDGTTQKWKNTSKIQTLTNQVKDMNNVLGAKNFVALNRSPYKAQMRTSLASVTNQTEDSVTLTSNAVDYACLHLYYMLPAGQYIVSYDFESDDTSYQPVITLYGNGNHVIRDGNNIPQNEQRVVTVEETDKFLDIRLFITKAYDAVIRTGTFKNFMVRLASITDDTYAPYAKTNQQLTQDTTALLDNTEVNGAVNMLPNNATSQVVNGITFTVNDDGTVTANGTATANTLLYLRGASGVREKNPSDSIRLSGCPSGGDVSTYSISAVCAEDATGTNTTQKYDKGNGVIINNKYFNVFIRISAGTTVTNLTFKPMITVPSYNGDYVPYAKSNKELTEDVESIESDVTNLLGGILTNSRILNISNKRYVKIGRSSGAKNYMGLIAIATQPSGDAKSFIGGVANNVMENAITPLSALTISTDSSNKIVLDSGSEYSHWIILIASSLTDIVVSSNN